MSISIINKCSKNIIFKQSEEEKLIKPREKVFLNENNSCFSLKTEEKSRKEKFSNSYAFSLESFYDLENANGEIFIKKEIIKASCSPSITYERLLPTNENLKPKYYSIMGKEEVLKAYKKNRLFDIFLFEPILLHTLSIEFYILIILGLVLGFVFSPFVSVIYFICLYLISLSIELIASKTVDTVFSKIFKTKTSKEEFKKYVDEDFVYQYFKEKIPVEDVKTDFIN